MGLRYVLTVLVVFAVAALGVPAMAGEAAEEPEETEVPEEVNNGQDFTKPLTRLDVRLKYQDIPGNSEATFLTLRMDMPFILDQGWMLVLRADVPHGWSSVPSRDNPTGTTQNGWSDILVQALVITPPQGKWAYGFGSQLVFPTATKDQLGTGKVQFIPTAAARYDLGDWMPGAWCAGLLRHAVDIGGQDSRAYVNQTYLQPILNLNLPEQWFLTFAPEARYDWRTENWHVPFDVTVGKLVKKNVVVSIEYKTAIVDDLPLYDDEVELRIGFFF